MTGRSELKTNRKVSIICVGDIKLLGPVRFNSNNLTENRIILVSTYEVANNRLTDIDDEEICIDGEFETEELKEITGVENEYEEELNIDNRRTTYKSDKENGCDMVNVNMFF